MMRRVTHLGGARFTIGLPLGLALLDATRRVGLAMLLANAISHIAVQVLKRVVSRARPCDAAGNVAALIALPDPFSFPSGHAAAITALATTAGIAYPTLLPFVVPLAVLVAVSRIRLRVHHVSDVLAGMALGVGGAALAAHLAL